jgi:hypothetical protein
VATLVSSSRAARRASSAASQTPPAVKQTSLAARRTSLAATPPAAAIRTPTFIDNDNGTHSYHSTAVLEMYSDAQLFCITDVLAMLKEISHLCPSGISCTT